MAGSAMGTATGTLVRNMLVIASDSESSSSVGRSKARRTNPFRLPAVICRYGSHLCVCSAKGTKLHCTVTDVMSVNLDTKGAL